MIFVSARSEVNDVAYTLTLGADDFVSNPVCQLELLTRIEALARRLGRHPLAADLEDGPYRFDPDRTAPMFQAPSLISRPRKSNWR